MAHPIDASTPTDREIRVTRLFDAPRRLVFDCHTIPDLVRRWMLGPPGWTMPVCEIDLRVGGQYHHVWRSDADGSQFGFRGEYREIVSPERLVHTERYEAGDVAEGGEGGASGEASEALCTLTLTEEGGRTRLTQTMRFATPEIRDQVLQTGMADGMGMSYDRLDTVMDEQKVAGA